MLLQEAGDKGMSNTNIVFGMILFYGILGVFLILFGNPAYSVQENPAWVNEWNDRLQSDDVGFWENIFINIVLFIWGVLSFALRFFYVVAGMPWWLNAIIFTPLVAMSFYLVASFVRGNSG